MPKTKAKRELTYDQKRERQLAQRKLVATRVAKLADDVRLFADDISQQSEKYPNAPHTDEQRKLIETAHHNLRRFMAGDGRR